MYILTIEDELRANHVSENIPYCTNYHTCRQTLRSFHENWRRVCTANSSRDWKRKDFSRPHTWMQTCHPSWLQMQVLSGLFPRISRNQVWLQMQTPRSFQVVWLARLSEKGVNIQVLKSKIATGAGGFSDSNLDDVDWFQTVYPWNILGLKEKMSSHHLESWTESMQKWGLLRLLEQSTQMAEWGSIALMSGDPQLEYSSLCLNLVLQMQPLHLFLVNIFSGGATLRSGRLDILLDATRLVWQ